MEKVSNFTSGVVQNLTPQPVERISLRPQIVTWDIPRPHAAVQGPTTDELHLMKQTNKAKEASDANEQMRSAKEDLTGEGRAASQRAKGLWNVVRNFTTRTVVEAQAGTNRIIRDRSVNKDLSNFVEEFPDIANSGAVHISQHECMTSHSNVWQSCTVHLTTTHLCMAGTAFCDALPLKMIASIIPSVDLPTTDGSPLLVETPDPRVVVKGLQVYTTSKKCYLFARFNDNVRHKLANRTVEEMTPVYQFYVNLDRAWRAEVKVPLPNVQYAKVRTGLRTEIIESPLKADPAPPVAQAQPAPTVDEKKQSDDAADGLGSA